MVYFYVFLYSLSFGLLTSSVAASRGFGKVLGFIFGFAFGIFGLIYVFVTPINTEVIEKDSINSGKMKKCPQCAELVKIEAIICRYCNNALSPTPVHISNPKTTLITDIQLAPDGGNTPISDPLPFAHPDSLTSEQLKIMDEFSISYDGDKFHFCEYRYERLSDAVNYAKLQASKEKPSR